MGKKQGDVAYAAIDLGASSGRVVLGTRLGDHWKVEVVHRFEHRSIAGEAGEIWDHEELFEHTIEGVRRAVARCKELGQQLCGLGVDSWGVDWVLVSAEGQVKLPGSSYRGSSLADVEPVIADRSLTPEEVYEISGIPDDPINTGLRLPAVSEATLEGSTLLFVPDLWLYWLTGSIGTDPTIASTSQLLDIRSGRFSDSIVQALGLGALTLPEVLPVGAVAGVLLADLAQRVGAPYDIPVYRVAGHDTAAAFAFADPLVVKDECLISSGTWSLVGCAMREPITSQGARRRGFSNERGASGTLLLRNITGLWILQECMREWALAGQRIDLETLLAAVSERAYDARVFDPSAPELFEPGGMEGRVRELCAAAGRQLGSDRVDLVHAILDSLAAAYAAGIRAAEEVTGRTFQRVRIVGGGSRNARVCKLTAELSGLPVIAGPVEASAIGNLAIQAVASGAADHPADVFAALDPEALSLYFPGETGMSVPGGART